MRVLLVLIAICFYSPSILLGQDLYVADDTNSRVEVFDGTTGQSKGVFADGGGIDFPTSLAFGGPNNDLYVASFFGNPFNPQILRYNGSTGEFIEPLMTTQPITVLFGPDGNLYFTGFQFSGVRRYDLSTGTISDFITGVDEGDATVDSNGDFYLIDRDNGEISQYDGSDGSFVGTLVSGLVKAPSIDEPGESPGEIAFGPDGNLYVNIIASTTFDNGQGGTSTAIDGGFVNRYDGVTGELIGTFIPFSRFGFSDEIMFGPDGNFYAARENRIDQYNGTTGEFQRVFAGVVESNRLSSFTFGPTFTPAPDPLELQFPNGLPDIVDPNGGTTVRVVAVDNGLEPEPDSGVLFYDVGNGFESVPMTVISPNVYDAVIPASNCFSEVRYYFAVNATDGSSITAPADAPDSFFSSRSADSIAVGFSDDFESDQGWTVTGSAIDGQWERGVPVAGGLRGDAQFDADGSGACFLTDHGLGNSDVDDGDTILTSPLLDASSSGTAILSYYRWYSSDTGATADDIFEVEISNDDGSTWVDVETVGPTGPETGGGWTEKSFVISQFIAPTAQMRVRFIASDFGDGGIVEAGVDGVRIEFAECDGVGLVILGDVNLDGMVNFLDISPFIGVLTDTGNNQAEADTNEDGMVNFLDIAPFINILISASASS